MSTGYWIAFGIGLFFALCLGGWLLIWWLSSPSDDYWGALQEDER